LRNEFTPRKALYGYEKDRHGFAFVNRSMRVLTVDIDGKNGGLQHVLALGNMPYTKAEISKSGNGYHLFFETDQVWDDEIGFDSFGDHIGIVQGVDIRDIGCVFHWKQQRWNDRPIAPLPDFLADLLTKKREMQRALAERVAKVTIEGDP